MGSRPRGKVVIVNSRWVARIVAVLMLLAFFLLMANLQRRLMEMRQMQDQPVQTTTR